MVLVVVCPEKADGHEVANTQYYPCRHSDAFNPNKKNTNSMCV